MKKILLVPFIMNFLYSSDLNYEYENKHIDKFIDVNYEKLDILKYKVRNDLNLTNFVSIENISKNVWINSEFANITLDRYIKKDKIYKDIVSYEKFHKDESIKLRDSFFIKNSNGLNKRESLYLYLKIFDFGSIEDVKLIKNDREESYLYFEVLNKINNMSNIVFENQTLSDILNDYKSYNYSSKIKANLFIKKNIPNVLDKEDFTKIIKIIPDYNIEEVELISSYYYIFSKLNLTKEQKEIINKMLISYEDEIIKILSIFNMKDNCTIENCKDEIKKLVLLIEKQEYTKEELLFKYLINKKDLDLILNKIKKRGE